MIVIGREEVRERLSYEACIPLVREAMIALSRGITRQLPRSIIDLDEGRAFGVMPGAMGPGLVFGAKLISVYPENFEKGLQSHQGLVALFDPETGALAAIVHAGEITAIRTAAASAVATDALARPGASRLAILGYGEQAHTHLIAISKVRKLSEVRVWGRSPERAAAFAAHAAETLGVAARAAASVETAVADADIICAVSAAAEPILHGRHVAEGCHVNLVGSSRAGPAEADDDLVVRSRFFADHRRGVLLQGAEFLNAKASGRIDDRHLLGEIGDVLDGRIAGRISASDVTVYKSLGSIVQDLSSAWLLYEQARVEGFGVEVAF
ncbi:ornithine cyclodeaminase family protein [Caulobacter sp. 17J80-11]|uniref:ornithine cyclodeaminase family protein n=1 Tax=Caulobacter sp. 17J80-11 TaxID=2763502 RepID=UPI0016535CC8|nr:ornithine cyclodeaminase family protein [Caulobacter sp. 17J80-11]MBC6983757.1 ornithine cyclodeaminase family protein [Caulobacter sp. 17J80-11]